MTEDERTLQQWLDEGALTAVKREILGIANDEERRAILERLFVSDLTCAGAMPNRGQRLISLELHVFLLPDAVERIKKAVSDCLVSSALEAGIARRFGDSLDRLPFTEAQLVQRRPVWSALSDLFLDTEVRPEIAHAAWVCDMSQLPKEELGSIWYRELSPVLSPNLVSPAGEWAGFDLDWLERRIVERRCQVHSSHKCVNQSVWKQVFRLMEWLRGWPKERRRAVAERVNNQVRVALGFGAIESSEGAAFSLEERERCWQEGTRPLLEALHVNGQEPALSDVLAKGRPRQ